MAMARMMFPIPAPRMVTIIMAARMVGNPMAASVARMITVSTQRPA
ncbi:MAG: hypothetical protein O6649_04910 [Gammaproteobacteria bacterium]|nr:hypothetical protein [Gammaproteobacteria bacterium]